MALGHLTSFHDCLRKTISHNFPEPDPCISNNASYFAIHHQHANSECISAQLPLSAIYAFEVPPSVVHIIQLHFALDNNEKCSLMYVFSAK